MNEKLDEVYFKSLGPSEPVPREASLDDACRSGPGLIASGNRQFADEKRAESAFNWISSGVHSEQNKSTLRAMRTP